MKKKKLTACAAALVICCCALFSGTIAYAANYNVTPLEEAIFILDMYFVDHLSDQARQADSIEELINIIDDPYTTYMSTKIYEEFMDGVENEFSGIGITVEQAEDGILITSVLKGSGAEAAGLKAGDIILEADGRVLQGMDLSKALTYIKGEEGAAVDLKIKRGSEQFTVGVQNSKLELPTVEGRMLDGNIAYIQIYSFGSDTDEDLEEYLRKFEAENPTGYIIDVRSNGGGYVDTALEIAGFFIGDNVAMCTSNKWELNQYAAISDDIMIDRPVFMLVDLYSASASEILCGALRDYCKALLVGMPTFGKGTMQSLFPLSNEGILKVTTNYTYTPSGESFNNVGLEPDIETGEEGDPYYATILMLGGDAEAKESKQGYMAIEIYSELYDINLEQARQDEYWESYRALITDTLQKGRGILLGTSEGWEPFEYQNLIHRYYYPNHKELQMLTNIEPSKVFSVTFSRPVSLDTLDGKIYLIDSYTGERIDCKVAESDSAPMKVEVMPSRLLERGKEYYLVMDKGIQSVDGGELDQGILCRARVMN